MSTSKNDKHDGHRERMREKFIKYGADAFNEHEFLEMLLYYSISRKNTNEIAHDLINHFGNFKNVFDADIKELEKVSGIGENCAFLIKLIPELSRLYFESGYDNSKKKMCSKELLYELLIPKYIGKTNECCYVVFMDMKYRLISCDMLFEGTFNRVDINFKKILERALRYKATNIVISHNHLNDTFPSASDVVETKRLLEKLENVQITLCDHIIISNNQALSMKESGYFESFK